MPRTLVHGDFEPKNMRVRSGPAGVDVLLFDWETAGWGVPAPDLARLGRIEHLLSVDLRRYYETVRESWSGLCPEDVEHLAAVGTLFRLLAMLVWESLELAYKPPQATMAPMRMYAAELKRGLQKAGLT